MLKLMIPRNGASSTRLPPERSLVMQGHDGVGTAAAMEYSPRADIIENSDSIVLRLEMPGVTAEDIDVSLDKDVLSVTAERKAPVAEGQLFHRSELVYGTFTRAFTLPAIVDRDRVDASYVNGILTVTMAKAAESKPKIIEVKIS